MLTTITMLIIKKKNRSDKARIRKDSYRYERKLFYKGSHHAAMVTRKADISFNNYRSGIRILHINELSSFGILFSYFSVRAELY